MDGCLNSVPPQPARSAGCGKATPVSKIHMKISRILPWLPALFFLCLTANAESILWYNKPASEWREALPVGNGRIGAMVFGGISEEQIQLNESSVWSGNPKDFDRPGVFKHFPEIRKLIFDGRNSEVDPIINQEVLGERPLGCYQPLGDLRLNLLHQGEISDYRRELDLSTAVVKISYRAGDTVYTREVFSSAPDHVLVVRLSCSKPGALNLTARLGREENAESSSTGQDELTLNGQTDRGKATAGTIFQATLKAVCEDGALKNENGLISVKDANSVTLYVCARTNYQKADAAKRCREDLLGVSRASYEKIKERHIKDHQGYFNRVSLSLGPTPELPTDERLRRVKEGATDNGLLALQFQFGRYLLISSSRPGGLPANLQGIWNQEIAPPWFCGWHFDINAQMNYWLAESTNLSECHLPFLDFINALRTPGRKTAREVLGCSGFVVAHRTNAWLFSTPVKGLALWPPAAGWLTQHMWEHYRFTQDRQFLQKVGYPAIKDSAAFFLDWLVPNPETGKLVSGPSISPENVFLQENGKPAGVDMGPAMDQQIAAEVFDNFLAASEIIGEKGELVEKIRAARARLAGPQIGKDGRLLEWSKPYAEREPAHRHLSHLYGLMPGWQISPEQTPELAEAARKSLIHRIQSVQTTGDSKTKQANTMNTGWTLAWITNLWARLGDGDQANAALWTLLRNATLPNLMTVHPGKDDKGVFQIDANLGAPAGIAEMLLQSHTGVIHLLPALPKDWPEGSVRGLRARGDYTVDISWKGNQLLESAIRAGHDGTCRLRAAGFAISKNGQPQPMNAGAEIREVQVRQGDILTVTPSGR